MEMIRTKLDALKKLAEKMGGNADACQTNAEAIDVIAESVGGGGDSATEITLYVDAANGSDENDGLTTSTQFKTMEKAVEEAQKYKHCEINVTSNISFPNIEIKGVCDILITGSSSITLTGSFEIMKGARVAVQNVTVHNAEPTINNDFAIKVNTGGHLLLLGGCTISIAEHYYGRVCVRLDIDTTLVCNVVKFGGAPNSSIINGSGPNCILNLYKITNNTTNSAKCVSLGIGAICYIWNDTEITYTANAKSLVYYNGVQTHPTTT